MLYACLPDIRNVLGVMPSQITNFRNFSRAVVPAALQSQYL